MSASGHGIHRDARHSRERLQTAWLLRAIRRADPGAAEDMIEWVFASVPDNIHVRRRKIELLLRNDDLGAADALIAQWLLRRPADPSMATFRAQSLLRQGDLRRAADEMRFVLRRRPHHVGAHLLAAEVARGLGRHARAVHCLRRAAARRPLDQSIRARLVQSLIESNRCQDAERELETMRNPSPRLEALLRQAQGRWLDAAATLRAALADQPAGPEATAMRIQLMDLLEQIGDAAALREQVEAAGDASADESARAAAALLWLGSFKAAAARAAGVVRRHPAHASALHTLVVAAELAGRPRLARSGLRRLQATRAGIDRRRMAAAWRTGLQARLMLEQRSARDAGADPSRSVLQPLLREAVRTLEQAIRVPGADADGLRTHRATCLAAMGREREALAELQAEVPSGPARRPAAPDRQAA